MRLFSHWRRWFRVLHRDLGYLFFGVTVAYCVSGLALNHRRGWNPNYSVSRQETTIPVAGLDRPLSAADIKGLLAQAGIQADYQSHYSPGEGQVKIFFQGGNALWDRSSGKLVVETLHRRPLLNTFNRLHLNPGRWWTWFADLFTLSLLIVAVTGLFLLPGRQGITRRGGVLVAIGIVVPVVLVLFYL